MIVNKLTAMPTTATIVGNSNYSGALSYAVSNNRKLSDIDGKILGNVTVKYRSADGKTIKEDKVVNLDTLPISVTEYSPLIDGYSTKENSITVSVTFLARSQEIIFTYSPEITGDPKTRFNLGGDVLITELFTDNSLASYFITWFNEMNGNKKAINSKINKNELISKISSQPSDFNANSPGVKSLEGMQLFDNEIMSQLGGTIFNFNFSNNQIQNVDCFAEVTSIGRVDLSNNPLLSLAGFGKVTKAEVIKLKNTKLTNVDGLENLKSIGFLGISNSELQNISGLKNIQSIDILDLSNNKLANVDTLEKLTTARKIDLSNNKIISIEGLKNLETITGVSPSAYWWDYVALNLQYNKLSNVDPLSKLRSVKECLNLSNNNLLNADGLSSLQSVGTLDLTANLLTDLNFYNSIPNNALRCIRIGYNYINGVENIIPSSYLGNASSELEPQYIFTFSQGKNTTIKVEHREKDTNTLLYSQTFTDVPLNTKQNYSSRYISGYNAIAPSSKEVTVDASSFNSNLNITFGQKKYSGPITNIDTDLSNLSFSVDDTSVLIYDDELGRLKVLKLGQANISIYDSGVFRGSYDVTVQEPAVNTITFYYEKAATAPINKGIVIVENHDVTNNMLISSRTLSNIEIKKETIVNADELEGYILVSNPVRTIILTDEKPVTVIFNYTTVDKPNSTDPTEPKPVPEQTSPVQDEPDPVSDKPDPVEHTSIPEVPVEPTQPSKPTEPTPIPSEPEIPGTPIVEKPTHPPIEIIPKEPEVKKPSPNDNKPIEVKPEPTPIPSEDHKPTNEHPVEVELIPSPIPVEPTKQEPTKPVEEEKTPVISDIKPIGDEPIVNPESNPVKDLEPINTKPINPTPTENKVENVKPINQTYKLRVQIIGEGKVSTNPSSVEYKEGESVSLTTLASEVWKYTRCLVNWVQYSDIPQITMNQDTTVTVHFEETQKPIQLESKVGIVYGIIRDNNGKPMLGVLVELHSDPRITYTNAAGEYKFDNIEIGAHTLLLKNPYTLEEIAKMEVVTYENSNNEYTAKSHIVKPDKLVRKDISLTEEENVRRVDFLIDLKSLSDDPVNPVEVTHKSIPPIIPALVAIPLMFILGFLRRKNVIVTDIEDKVIKKLHVKVNPTTVINLGKINEDVFKVKFMIPNKFRKVELIIRYGNIDTVVELEDNKNTVIIDCNNRQL
jgi:hypothetical protein